MSRLLGILLALFWTACAESNLAIGIRADPISDGATKLAHIEIFLSDATKDANCSIMNNYTQIKTEFHSRAYFNSFLDFESKGFVGVNLENLSTSKKLMLVVLTLDIDTGKPTQIACIDNLHVEKSMPREIQINLMPVPSQFND